MFIKIIVIGVGIENNNIIESINIFKIVFKFCVIFFLIVCIVDVFSNIVCVDNGI